MRRKNYTLCETWHLCSDFQMGPFSSTISIAFSMSPFFLTPGPQHFCLNRTILCVVNNGSFVDHILLKKEALGL